jgi:hypothetical protein
MIIDRRVVLAGFSTSGQFANLGFRHAIDESEADRSVNRESECCCVHLT